MATLEKINISLIQPSAMNPRKTFDQSLIEDLAQNIAEQGLLQPITIRGIEFRDYVDDDGVVVSIPEKYEVVCGERRFRAWSFLAAKKPKKYECIPAIVRDMNDKEAFYAMITENLQRKDVDPIEEANAISLLMQRGNSTSEIAARLGKSERFVTDRVKLAGLIPELCKLLQDGMIPLTGALILAKLDADRQKEFYDYNGEDDASVSTIKNFVERLFGEIDKYQFYDEDGFDEKLPLCSKCNNNTANFKCLFYEMKGESPRCTNRKCLQKKETEYLLYRIRKDAGNLVKAGEPLAPGRMVVVVEEAGTWWTDEEKAYREMVISRIKEIGVEVANPDTLFTSKCWYDSDDPRVKEILDTHKGYRTLTLRRVYGKGFEVDEQVWYLRTESGDGSASLAEIERTKIEQKMKRNDELKQEKVTETLTSWAHDKKDYFLQSAPLTSAEKIVFSVLLLRECGYSFRREIGMDNEIGTNTDDFGFVGKHSEDMGKWMRGFIRNKLSEGSAVHDSSLQRCQDMLFADQYPKEYRELIAKYDKEYDRKNEKLQEKLDKLKKE